MEVLLDFFHNLVDGFFIGAAFHGCKQLGWSITAATIAHEIPQEVADFYLLTSYGEFTLTRTLPRTITYTCTLTHSTLSFFASLCHSARACMHGCTRATPPRSGVETGLPPHSPVQPFSAAFFFELSSFFQKLRHPLLSATPCVRHLDTMNLPQPRAPSRR